jgi:hypothetical protein
VARGQALGAGQARAQGHRRPGQRRGADAPVLPDAQEEQLKKHAQAELDAYRDEQGLSEDALADRLVPDLGPRRERDDGLRLRSARLPRRLRPGPAAVRRGPGRRPGGLAAATGKSDDAEKAAEARELWDALKKEAKGLAAEQLRRLERAMVARREWDRAQLDRYFLKHPLMQHVARRLIWGVVDPARRVATTGFRVAEDGTFAGEEDGPFALPEEARVVVWHPLDMPAETRQRFTQLLTDYVVIQPFPQLARELFTATDEEKRASQTGRWKGARARGERFFTLKHRGWRFMDYDMSKPVAAEADPKGGDRGDAGHRAGAGLPRLQARRPDAGHGLAQGRLRQGAHLRGAGAHRGERAVPGRGAAAAVGRTTRRRRCRRLHPGPPWVRAKPGPSTADRRPSTHPGFRARSVRPSYVGPTSTRT